MTSSEGATCPDRRVAAGAEDHDSSDGVVDGGGSAAAGGLDGGVAEAASKVTEPLLVAGLAATSATLVGVVYPRYPELFPTCPSRVLFGVYCPLCGGTRSANALAMGRPRDAFDRNAFVPVLVVLAAWSWLAWTGRSIGRRWLAAVPRWLWWTFGGLWLVYGVLRNLPVEPFTSWAP